MASDRARHVRGILVIDLVKFLKDFKKTKPLPALGPSAQALLGPRLVATDWYPLPLFLELLQATNLLVIKGQEARAIEFGAAGGVARLKGAYKAYLHASDPAATIIALRHVWPSQYDFGRLSADCGASGAVEFVLDDYVDVGMMHAMTIVGWGLAAARLSGSAQAYAELIERPWQGSSRLRYRIRF